MVSDHFGRQGEGFMDRLLRKISAICPGRNVIAAIVWGLICLVPPGLLEESRAAPATWDEPEISRDVEVSISTDQLMDFGQLVDMDGSVTLGLADAITSDPSDMHFGGAPYSGIYTLRGDPDAAVEITLSSTPSNGFTLSNFVTSEGVAAPSLLATLDPTGELVLTIGATLTLDGSVVVLGSGQSISFTITTIYN
jgi:hypothetical protein